MVDASVPRETLWCLSPWYVNVRSSCSPVVWHTIKLLKCHTLSLSSCHGPHMIGLERVWWSYPVSLILIPTRPFSRSSESVTILSPVSWIAGLYPLTAKVYQSPSVLFFMNLWGWAACLDSASQAHCAWSSAHIILFDLLSFSLTWTVQVKYLGSSRPDEPKKC